MNRSLIVKLIAVAFVIHGMCEAIGFCDYPTYYNSDSGECVLTCPSGTIGNVSRTANPTMRNCTSLFPGYNLTFNATEYEFDVDVFSPVGTVLFEAFLLVENRNIRRVEVHLDGNPDSVDPFNCNQRQILKNILVTVSLDEALDPNDNSIDHNFNIDYAGFTSTIEGTRRNMVYNGSVNVILHEISPARISGIDISPVDCLILEENNTLTCVLTGIPQPTIQWYIRDGNTLVEDSEKYTIRGEQLVINNVSYSDINTSYECAARNIAGGVIWMDNITQSFPACRSPMNVSIIPINSSVDRMTDNVTFTCHTDTHNLNINYTWMFNNMYIDTSNSDSFTVNGPWLTVYNVTHSLGGVYECIVTNLIGSGRSYSYLFVNPYITHQPVSQVAIPNGIVNFTCIVVAYPPPTYNWVTPIDNSSFNSNVIILEYEDIKPEYIGEYTCIASSNGMMVNSSTVYLSDNGCIAEQDSVWSLNWPPTEAGSTAVVECPNSAEGQAYRYCQSSNLWDPFINVSECQSSQLVELEEQAVELKHLIADDILTYLTEVEDVSEATTSFIFTSQEQGPILPNDLNITNSIIDAIICILDNSTVEMAESDNTESILESVSNTIDHLLNDSSNIRTSYQESDKVQLPVAEDLLKNAENFARTVGHLLNTDTNATSINITKDNFMLRAELVPDDPTTVVFTDSGTEVTVTIPASALVYQRSIDMEATNMQVVNFIAKNLPSYLNDSSLSNDDRLVTSLLVSSQISDYKVDLPMNSSVELIFGNPMLDTEDGEGERVSRIVDPVCVFWNFSLPSEDSEATGGWSSDGIIQDNDPSLPVVCKTTHLTSFSVLVTTEEPAESGSIEALSIVSYIGCGVSIACLLLTIVVIILLRKVLIETKIYVIHFNLSIALLLTLIAFVSGIETAKDNKEGCIVVAALLHYFLLATFCWMLCEGIKLFMMLMFVFYNGFFQKLHFFLIVGWGTPIPFVVIPAVLLGEDYHDGSDTKVCWISNAEYAIWTFVAPAGLIILVNIVLMIIALIKIRQSKKKATKKSSKILTNAWTILWGMMILMPLLGISWVLGLFFIIDSDSVAFAWIFTIVNSLQGAVIFYLHILRNDRIKAAIHEKYTNWKKMKALQITTTKDTYTLERPQTDTNSKFILRNKPTTATVQLHAILESKTSYDSDIASPVQPNGCSTFLENKTSCDSEATNPVHDKASMDDDDNNRNEVLY